jgi:pimeloyl-ACP methyl ester carboxylesterase
MGCLKKGLFLIAGLLIVLVLLIFAGVVYETLAESAVADQYPAPGQIVEVNGRNMHTQCLGEGSPTIILDAGQGGWSSDWAYYMTQLSADNHVCAYDRAGYGWSDPADDDRSPQDAADDLAAMLSAAQIKPPYLLVGFSHAGLANRLFAAQHADQMAGLLLIDPATEFDKELMSPELIQQQQAAVSMFQGFGFAAKTGLLRLLGTQNMAGSAPFISTDPANPDVYYTFISDPQWWKTSVQEFVSGLDDDNLKMVRGGGTIPEIPLIIIGSDLLDAGDNPAMDGLQEARHETLIALAAQSGQGQFIVAEGSTHNIPQDRPDVILESVATVLAASE